MVDSPLRTKQGDSQLTIDSADEDEPMPVEAWKCRCGFTVSECIRCEQPRPDTESVTP